MINYRCVENPRTSNYSHGGHVHNLVHKAFQGHDFGGMCMSSLQPRPQVNIQQTENKPSNADGLLASLNNGNSDAANERM